MSTKNNPELELEELEELEEELEEGLETGTSGNGKGQRLSDAVTFKKLKEKFSGSEERISPIKAIRLKCLDCCCGQRVEVNLCPCEDCALWPFRFGKNPYSTKTFSDEQKAAMAERMRSHRENKKKA